MKFIVLFTIAILNPFSFQSFAETKLETNKITKSSGST